jgi:hypothetical protein
MSGIEIAVLVFIIAAFAVFAAVLAWLSRDEPARAAPPARSAKVISMPALPTGSHPAHHGADG